jgi:formylmethanofuran dehydrogenase subunit C
VSEGLVARLKSRLEQRADFSEVMADSWSSLSAIMMAERPVYLERDGRVALGDLFEIGGKPDGHFRFEGDLAAADRLGAGLSGGQVTVEGNVGTEAGAGMSGGALVIKGMRASAPAPPHLASCEV